MISLTSLTLSDTKEPSSLINEHNFTLLTNLRKLKVRNDYFDRSATIVNVNNLRHLIHLTHLNSNAFCSSKEEFENRYGVNFQVFDNFKELKEVKFTFERAHVDCTLVQETYPSVRFLWLDTEYLPVKNYYEGELDEENYFSGKGFMYYSNGDIYEGEWKRRQREGRGIMKYYNGSVYEGEWKSNQREGKGIIKFTHGGIFEGPWSNDSIVPSGTAIWIFLDGDRYEGGYKLAGSKLIREGKGVTTCPNGYRIEGQWQDGKLNGFGSQFYVNENRYQGEWKNGKKEGEGIFLYSNGGHYQGSFQDNRIEGIGTIVYANGDRYKGEWKNNKKEGKGVYVYANYLVSF